MIKDQAIFNLYPSAVTVGNEGEFVLDKDMNPITIDETKVEEEYKKLKAEYDAQQYARDRKTEYDALNQLELISDDAINGTTTHKDAIVAIKTKYPK